MESSPKPAADTSGTPHFRIPNLPGCGHPAVRYIEVYSPRDGRAHGSLDGYVYACEQHIRPFQNTLHAANYMSGFERQDIAVHGKRCGEGRDWANKVDLIAPQPEGPLRIPATPAPVGRRSAYDLVHAGIVAAGLPVPQTIHLYDFRSLVLILDEGDLRPVERWAAWLGLPAPKYGQVRNEGRTRSYRSAVPRGASALPGWSIDVYCSVPVTDDTTSTDEATEVTA